MITEKHTFEEIHSELKKEEEWMSLFLNRNKSKIYRFFLKKSSYPAWGVEEGETPRKNKYILFLECRSKKDLSSLAIASHIVWHYNNGGITVAILAYDYEDVDDNTSSLYVFSPHVFSRYRERFLNGKNMRSGELIKTFFQNNLHLDWREGVDEKHWEGVMKEGILFAVRENRDVFHVKTFVTWDMLFESQEYMKTEMYDSLKEMMDSEIKLPERFRKKRETKQSIEYYVKYLQKRMKDKRI